VPAIGVHLVSGSRCLPRSCLQGPRCGDAALGSTEERRVHCMKHRVPRTRNTRSTEMVDCSSASTLHPNTRTNERHEMRVRASMLATRRGREWAPTKGSTTPAS
jgi:hypothetical protein